MARRDDDTKPEDSALLPPQIRGEGALVIDQFIAAKLDKFKEALELSDASQDPLRAAIALENLRLAVDPRIDQAEVRSRSTALLNTIRVLGLDRDTQKVATDKLSVEQALVKLREAADRGVNAAGRTIQSRVSESSATLPDGQEVLLREPPKRSKREVPVGPIRTTLSDSGEDSERNRPGPGRRASHTIDYPEGSTTQD